MLPLEEWWYEMPIITRTYVTLALATTLACQLDLVQPYLLHFSYDLVFRGGQYWRLLTSFLYFGSLSIDFVFHMFFLVRYLRTLEEGYFRGRTVDFAWMLLLEMASIIVCAQSKVYDYVLTQNNSSDPHANILPKIKLDSISKLSAHIHPHLPLVAKEPTSAITFFWALCDKRCLFAMGVSWIFTDITRRDLVGLLVGHVYYFLDDVWPRGGGTVVGGRRVERPRIVRAPEFVKTICAMVSGFRGNQNDAALPREFANNNVDVVADEDNGEIVDATGEYEVWNGDNQVVEQHGNDNP
ncbi:Derlin-2 [Physocladia obscura]|uniref:Derlin n=1 Tax=Physocladia obscura TaxID=109957 RepID=A0AAD5T186_9FUNG|nr:Derlin-2 [Physocladia obscura]